jgi:hypothetical protein
MFCVCCPRWSIRRAGRANWLPFYRPKPTRDLRVRDRGSGLPGTAGAAALHCPSNRSACGFACTHRLWRLAVQAEQRGGALRPPPTDQTRRHWPLVSDLTTAQARHVRCRGEVMSCRWVRCRCRCDVELVCPRPRRGSGPPNSQPCQPNRLPHAGERGLVILAVVSPGSSIG